MYAKVSRTVRMSLPVATRCVANERRKLQAVTRFAITLRRTATEIARERGPARAGGAAVEPPARCGGPPDPVATNRPAYRLDEEALRERHPGRGAS